MEKLKKMATLECSPERNKWKKQTKISQRANKTQHRKKITAQCIVRVQSIKFPVNINDANPELLIATT